MATGADTNGVAAFLAVTTEGRVTDLVTAVSEACNETRCRFSWVRAEYLWLSVGSIGGSKIGLGRSDTWCYKYQTDNKIV